MKKFNKNVEEKKLNLKQNKNTYIKRASIVLSVIILIVGIIYFTYAKFESNKSYTLIQGTVTEAQQDINIIGIYQGEEKVDTIPEKGSGWAFNRAECTNDASAEWDINAWGLLVKSLGKTKCTLYFTEVTQTAVEYINSKGPTDDSLLTDGTADNNLRYVGANPNNYVKFNNELWRIIGVMNNIKTGGGQTKSLVKIIRSEVLNNTSYSWDTSTNSININWGINQWGPSTYEDGSIYEGADLMRELNYDYLGNIQVGTDGYWYNGPNNQKTAAKPEPLSSPSQSMIETVVWNTGSQGSNAVSTFTSPNMYTYERSTNTGKICSSGTRCNDSVTRTSTWTGKVALMYPSDYGYATSGGSTTNRATCLNTSMYNWNGTDVSDCKNNDWLYKSNYTQWTLSPFAYSTETVRVFTVNSSGNVHYSNMVSNQGVVPAVFLKSNISITGGDGSSTSPYTLG